MKKRPIAQKKTASAKVKADGLAPPLIAEVPHLIQSAQRGVASVIDTFQVMTNFEIGRRIVEHEQKGEKRAPYGAELTPPKDANIHAKEYQFYLPSKELLQSKLLEWVRAEEAKA